MTVDGQIEMIKKRLEITTADYDQLLHDLWSQWESIALDICNVAESNDSIRNIVTDTVAAAFLRRGDEGTTGSGAGGQSYSYTDLFESMKKQLVEANQRVYRL